MPYGETKVYFDGSHYIAIPHTTRPSRKRYKMPEETVEVQDDKNISTKKQSKNNDTNDTPSDFEGVSFELNGIEFEEVQDIKDVEDVFTESEPAPLTPSPRRMTRKELFEEGYKAALDLPRSRRKRYLIEKMRPYFPTENKTEEYVQVHLERKQRNLITRRVRMCRKANLQNFNYFCTFTYDSKLHNEDSFRRKLKTAFRHFCNRKGWKYMGVWERSAEKKRLHFHGIFDIPEGTMPEMCIERTDYSFNAHKRQTINQNTYFLTRFGRNDFEPIDDKTRMGEALAYLMKYIEKSEEKIVYSRGLPQFFKSDILDEDVITVIGQEERKLLLYDDFRCFDEGCYVGVVSPDIIKQMPKVN